MTGDEGPYMNDEGDVWVPRTVPFNEARRIAQTAAQEWDQYAKYVCKTNAELLGFAVECRCDEVCERRWRDEGEDSGDRTCMVPAWAFHIEEYSRPRG